MCVPKEHKVAIQSKSTKFGGDVTEASHAKPTSSLETKV